MTRTFFILLTAVVIIIPPGPATHPGASPLMTTAERRLRLSTSSIPPLSSPHTFLPSSATPLVTLRLVFRCGSQDDPPGKEGLAALTAAVIVGGGARGWLPDQLAERLYPLAAGLSAECRTESTVFAGTVHRDLVTRYMPLCAAILTSPRLDPNDFARLKREAIDRLAGTIRNGNAEQLAGRALQLGLYRGHPYGHVAAGTVAGLAAITFDDVLRFHQAHYNRESLLLGIAGDADKVAIEHIRTQLGPLPHGDYRDMPLRRPALTRGIDVTLVESPADTTAIALGFPLNPPPRDDDFLALTVAGACLSERLHALRATLGDSSVCDPGWHELVAEGPARALSPDDPRRQPAFAIVQSVNPPDAALALRGVLRELDRLIREGLTGPEFDAARDALLSTARVSGRTIARRLGQAMDAALLGRDEPASELARRLPKLSAAQVHAAICRHLSAQDVRAVIVTRDAAAIRSALLAADPSPRTRDEKGAIAAFPLRDLRVTVVRVGDLFAK